MEELCSMGLLDARWIAQGSSRVICSEDERDSPLTPEKQSAAFDCLLSSLSESSLSRALTAKNAREVWVTLRKLDAGKHASTALAYENEIHQQRYKDKTPIEDQFNSCSVLLAKCPM